ncbi:MAG: outer membrane beta-barrel protein [Crocinitomix sp.]|nr:outer membrane beta-barrel protein [Crocinitomix sp.]
MNVQKKGKNGNWRIQGIVFALFIIASSISWGQAYKASTEIGVYGGGSYYIGDLNPNKHFVNSKPGFGLVYRYNLSTRHSLRATAFYGNVYGDDAEGKTAAQLNRNLNFKSSIMELAVGYEINLFKYYIKDMRDPITPYFFYQLAYTRINPMTDYSGNDIALQPLGTEGQGTSASTKNNYSLNQITIPLGIGLKFNLCRRVAMSFEYGIRKTFTDYLDDVSGNYVDSDVLRGENGPLAAELADRSLEGSGGMNRGNPNNKDWYSFYGMMITFKPFKKDICEFNQSF